jgi:gluconolactonase
MVGANHERLFMTRYAKSFYLGITVTGLLVAGCQTHQDQRLEAAGGSGLRVAYPEMGKIERFDPGLEEILPVYAIIERLAQGFDWSEGPVWVPSMRSLLFSDVPRNVVYRWHELEGVSVFLKPSGYTGPEARGGEPGSNGLTLDAHGRLVLCQHGDRRVARLESGGRFSSLTAHYKFYRYNSPNDLVYHSSGSLYFTDPPYGLEQGNKDPKKELMFSGVYRVSPWGRVTLLTDKLTFPNGIAFSPDELRLYVAVSDPQNPVIMVYPVLADGMIAEGRVFFDAKPLMAEGRKGLPDGLKTDMRGNVFATGPGGVLVISPDGQLLGLINTGEATANCAWGDDGSVLYITADDYLCRVKTWTQGYVPRPAR